MKAYKSKFISWGKFFIGWPLSVISIAFIVKFLADRIPLIESKISSINYLVLLIGVLLFFFYYFLRSILWKELLRVQGERVPLFENTYRFAVSELKRFAPGNIWSLLSRASLFSDLGVNNKVIGISLLMEIQLIIAGSFIFSLFSFPWLLSGDTQFKTAIMALLPASIIVACLFFFITSYLYRKRYDKSELFLNSLYLPGISISNKLKLTGISFIDFLIFGIGNYFIFLSVFNASFADSIILSSFFTFALLVGFLSFLTPMGLGIREGVVTLGLSKTLSVVDASFFAIFSRVFLILSELSYLLILVIIKYLIKFKK